MHYTFGDIVVVEGNLIGVIVKSWVRNNEKLVHEVYVRNYNSIKEYDEKDIRRYLVRHKELDEDEMYYQSNAENPFIDLKEIESYLRKLNEECSNE